MAVDRLVFDPALPTEGSNVGAYVLAGTDGDQIGSQNINSLEWLNVAAAIFAADGTALTETGGALDVNVASGSLDVTATCDLDGFWVTSTNENPDDVGIIAFQRGASPDHEDQTFRPTGGAASSDDVTAANVHGLDVNSFLMGFDGTTWDRVKATAGALDVNLASSTGSVNVNGSAQTSGAYGGISVTSTATLIPAAPLAGRRFIKAYNFGDNQMFYGFSNAVTVAAGANAGTPISKGSYEVFDMSNSVTLYGICKATKTTDCRWTELK